MIDRYINTYSTSEWISNLNVHIMLWPHFQKKVQWFRQCRGDVLSISLNQVGYIIRPPNNAIDTHSLWMHIIRKFWDRLLRQSIKCCWHLKQKLSSVKISQRDEHNINLGGLETMAWTMRTFCRLLEHISLLLFSDSHTSTSFPATRGRLWWWYFIYLINNHFQHFPDIASTIYNIGWRTYDWSSEMKWEEGRPPAHVHKNDIEVE